MKKSIVLSAFFPSSKANPKDFRAALDRIRPFDITVVEYYVENCGSDEAAKLLDGWESVFLCAALQKQAGLNPSSADAAERKKAVVLLADSMRFAVQAGAKAVLLNSGARPADEKQDADCLRYLQESLCEMHRAAGEVTMLLEPGDRDVEYRHLIGHTDVADAFIQDMRRDIPNIGLVFDTSHIAQLGETVETAWNTAKRSCSHVHFANCSLVKGTRYYGDKHPTFGIEGGVFSHDDARKFYRLLQDEKRPLTAGIEIICHDGNEEKFFGRVVDETGWFFQNKAQ